jgi:hypothetical protein
MRIREVQKQMDPTDTDLALQQCFKDICEIIMSFSSTTIYRCAKCLKRRNFTPLLSRRSSPHLPHRSRGRVWRSPRGRAGGPSSRSSCRATRLRIRSGRSPPAVSAPVGQGMIRYMGRAIWYRAFSREHYWHSRPLEFGKIMFLISTVKSSNFVILFSENIFCSKLSLGDPIEFSGIEVCIECG